ncbi:uncharacterized protein [Magallana gigas]|uniref:uncharacterized protein n=1 Tax=Magallana gigas TaxID=29159 RepID=UPI003342A082
MKEVMKIVQDNNLELERENLELQEKQKMLLLEKNELETQLGHCFREKQFAQDKSVNFLESIVEYQKETSNLKDSLREVWHERDAYVKQIENMMDNFSKNKDYLKHRERGYKHMGRPGRWG